MAHIELRDITKTFGGKPALKNLDLEVADGQFFVLLGETGAGKTTTMRIVAGLEQPAAGTGFLAGPDVASPDIISQVCGCRGLRPARPQVPAAERRRDRPAPPATPGR